MQLISNLKKHQSNIQKVLFVANRGRFYHFEKQNMRLLQNKGIEVHFAANFKSTPLDNVHPDGVILHQLDCTRAPFSKRNIRAYKSLKQIIEKEKFDVIHCHTPVGSVLSRLAARKARRKGTKVIYSAHGFHFYKGAPLKYWMLFYPVEWVCSWMTDVLITINREDYKRAKKHLHAKEIHYVPGVGVNTKKFNIHSFTDTERLEKRHLLGVNDDDIMLVAAGELNSNKNHQVVIQALLQLKNKNIKFFIAGSGNLKHELKKIIHDNGLDNNVHIIGFRKDLPELYRCADIFVFPSKREGLSVALMEAMASGLPVICSDIRGNQDLIDNGKGGYRIQPTNIEQWSFTIAKMISEKNQWKQYGMYNQDKISRSFSRNVVETSIVDIYDDEFSEG